MAQPLESSNDVLLTDSKTGTTGVLLCAGDCLWLVALRTEKFYIRSCFHQLRLFNSTSERSLILEHLGAFEQQF
ncbi:hypothetical protein FJTKL_12904 [Diaporthe vaccinii]|uniref:Uncharacterized protein n=1 Tax=Diaporthe vaccinii TaxID=105482 RepID=A0ABR4F9Z3_9PEZI